MKTSRPLRFVVGRFMPWPLIQRVRALRARRKCREARAAFAKAGVEPAWLGSEELERCQRQYALRNPQSYEEADVAERGAGRAEYLARTVARPEQTAFLELGCADGMVCHALRRRSKAATGVDLDAAFDRRAVEAGATLLPMDAHRLEFEDARFDVVYSYNAFEHFAKPDVVFAEALRVTRPGGRIYLHFGPLYFSPMGAHLYRQISVPYAHLLWPREILERHARARGAAGLSAPPVNGCAAEDYRRLWQSCRTMARRLRYAEWWDTAYVRMIEEHPTCFRSKTAIFDNLVVASMAVLFQKRS